MLEHKSFDALSLYFTESQNGFISSEMHSTLYNLAMDLTEHRRSVDIRYVEGALEGLLQTMFPHDEL